MNIKPICEYYANDANTNVRIYIIGDIIYIFAFYIMILSKILQFVKNNLDNIILFVIIVLFVLLSFATGYIIAKYQDREPVFINQSK